jgi:hypothetical protein
VALRLRHGVAELAQAGPAGHPRRGLHDAGGRQPARLPHPQQLSAASPCRAGGAVRAGAGDVPGGGPGAAGPCRHRRHQAEGECQQACGHELRPDAAEGEPDLGRVEEVVRGLRPHRRRGGREVRGRQRRVRAAGEPADGGGRRSAVRSRSSRSGPRPRERRSRTPRRRRTSPIRGRES